MTQLYCTNIVKLPPQSRLVIFRRGWDIPQLPIITWGHRILVYALVKILLSLMNQLGSEVHLPLVVCLIESRLGPHVHGLYLVLGQQPCDCHVKEV